MPLVRVTDCTAWILVGILGLGLFQGSGYSRTMHIQVSLDAGVLGYSSFRYRDISGYSQAGFSVVSYPDPYQIVMRIKISTFLILPTLQVSFLRFIRCKHGIIICASISYVDVAQLQIDIIAILLISFVYNSRKGGEAITATSMVIVIAQRVGLCIYMNITLKLYHVSNHGSLDFKL